MDKKQCQCHKEPCICGVGLCKNRNSTESTITENIDENGNSHFVESIYQKIPLRDFDNLESCCKSEEPDPTKVSPNNLESKVSSNNLESKEETTIIEEKVENLENCIECCENIYAPPSPDEKNECKNKCTITAELYCQIKRQKAEPGEIISVCSENTSSSDEDDDDSDENIEDGSDENIEDGSTEYVSAKGRSEENEDISEITNEDEDSFNPSAAFEDIVNRIRCKNESCCSLNHKCKYKKSDTRGDKNLTDDEKLAKHNQNTGEDSNNHNISKDDEWTTIKPEPPQNKNKKQQPIQNENDVESTTPNTINKLDKEYNHSSSYKVIRLENNKQQNNNENKHKKQQPIQNENDVESTPTNTINKLDKEYNHSSVYKVIRLDNNKQQNNNESEEDIDLNPSPPFHNILECPTGDNSNEATWTTIQPESNESNSVLPENETKFSGQSWKRQKLDFSGLPPCEDVTEQNNKPPYEFNENTEAEIAYKNSKEMLVKTRKRKYESTQVVFPDEPEVLFRNSDLETKTGNFETTREIRKSISGRRRRITLSNFVSEEELIVPKPVVDVSDTSIKFRRSTIKPEHIFSVIDKASTLQDDTRLWHTVIPCDRSDFNMSPTDLGTSKKVPKMDDTKMKTSLQIKDPRHAFIRKSATQFKPSKFLCFKFVPRISPKASITSIIGNYSTTQLCINPPEPLPTKYQGSRIPVSQLKPKIEQKRKRNLEFKLSDEETASPRPAARRVTMGVDELRNVRMEKCPTYRRISFAPGNNLNFSKRKSLIVNNKISDQLFEEPSEQPSDQPSDNEVLKKNIPLKKNKQKVTIAEEADGSDTSLRIKMEKMYLEEEAKQKLLQKEPAKNLGDAVTVWKKQKHPKTVNKLQQSGEPKAETKPNNIFGENKLIQKTCCSQTGIHICVKESITSNKGNEESNNILQMVNIDVTPKDSKFVKVNIMPTVPEINQEGIITIPVQLQLLTRDDKENPPFMATSTPKRDIKETLLYQENPERNFYEHYMEYLMEEEKKEESYANFLMEKIKDTLSESQKEEKTTTEFDNIETQTDLTLGRKLLSKSLNSITSSDSNSTIQNKSEPVKKTGINWNDILIPDPGSFVIKKTQIKKQKRRNPGENTKFKDNNIPSTSEGLPPTEEIKHNINPIKHIHVEKKLNCCFPIKGIYDEPYRETTNESNDEDITEIDEPQSTRSKIISLVFSESFYQNENYTNSLQKTLAEEEKSTVLCTSKPEIPWTNILLPNKPQIRKIEKLDISQTNTSITSTDEYNSTSPSPRTTDTCPNLSEDSVHSCACCKNYNDKGTNTTKQENEQVASTSTTMELMKSFKEDPVLSAFKAFEEELKPVRKALVEVQTKLRALNIPELECIFKKDFVNTSRSNINFGKEYTKRPATSYARNWPSDIKRSSACTRRPSHCLRRPSDSIDYYGRPEYDFRVYEFATPPIPTRSRPLSTDLWKAFGSCERNSVREPHEKFWKPPNVHKVRTVDSYNYPLNYQSRNSTPDSEFHYVSFNPSGAKRYNEKCDRNNYYCPNMIDKRVELINDDEDLDYPSNYSRNTHTSAYAQEEEYYCNDSEHSLYSNVTERLKQNAKFSSSLNITVSPSTNHNKRYIPVKVRPITHYFVPDDGGPNLHNPTQRSAKNLKSGVVYARTKIELPKVVYKRSNTVQKNIRKIYPQPMERNHYSCSEYDGFQNRQHNDCPYEYPTTDDNNLSIFSNCYQEYLKNEKYT